MKSAFLLVLLGLLLVSCSRGEVGGWMMGACWHTGPPEKFSNGIFRRSKAGESSPELVFLSDHTFRLSYQVLFTGSWKPAGDMIECKVDEIDHQPLANYIIRAKLNVRCAKSLNGSYFAGIRDGQMLMQVPSLVHQKTPKGSKNPLGSVPG